MTADDDRPALTPAQCEALVAERLGAFAARVSHDLKNPLSAVRMSLELAREELGPGADPGVRELLERAERGIRRVDALLDGLADGTARADG